MQTDDEECRPATSFRRRRRAEQFRAAGPRAASGVGAMAKTAAFTACDAVEEAAEVGGERQPVVPGDAE